jgi:hypothetical protein
MPAAKTFARRDRRELYRPADATPAHGEPLHVHDQYVQLLLLRWPGAHEERRTNGYECSVSVCESEGAVARGTAPRATITSTAVASAAAITTSAAVAGPSVATAFAGTAVAAARRTTAVAATEVGRRRRSVTGGGRGRRLRAEDDWVGEWQRRLDAFLLQIRARKRRVVLIDQRGAEQRRPAQQRAGTERLAVAAEAALQRHATCS